MASESKSDSSSNEGKDCKTRNPFQNPKLDALVAFDYDIAGEELSVEEKRRIEHVAQNLQGLGTSALSASGQNLHKNINSWVDFFLNACACILFFQMAYHRLKEVCMASLDVNCDLVEMLLDATTPAADAVKHSLVQTLKRSKGQLASVSDERETVNFLTIMRSYGHESFIVVYAAELQIKASSLKSICIDAETRSFKVRYDKYVFGINRELAWDEYELWKRILKEEYLRLRERFLRQQIRREVERGNKFLRSCYGLPENEEVKESMVEPNDDIDTVTTMKIVDNERQSNSRPKSGKNVAGVGAKIRSSKVKPIKGGFAQAQSKFRNQGQNSSKSRPTSTTKK